MFRGRSRRLVLSTWLRLPEHEAFRNLEWLTLRLANEVLEDFWTETAIDAIAEFRGRACRFFREKSLLNGDGIYLPSRFKRCLLELVGRTLRSQKARKDAFYRVRNTEAFRLVHLAHLYGMSIRRIGRRAEKLLLDEASDLDYHLVLQSFRFLVNLLRRGEDPTAKRYTELVAPRVRRFSLPLAPDDGQLLRIEDLGAEVVVSMKLPLTPEPHSPSDWRWLSFRLRKHAHYAELEQGEPEKPLIATHIQKSGVKQFILSTPFSIKACRMRKRKRSGVWLCADPGVRKPAAAVLMTEAGEQLSPPVFIRSRAAGRIREIWQHLRRIQAKLAKLRNKKAAGKKLSRKEKLLLARLSAEFHRLHNKLHNLRKAQAEEVAKALVELAMALGCDGIKVDSLSRVEPFRGGRFASYRLSSWQRGVLYSALERLCTKAGLEFIIVRGRSSGICPRCGAQGHFLTAPNGRRAGSHGAWFSCPECGYSADRDYAAALVIGLLSSREGSLEKLAAYKAARLPRSRSRGKKSTARITGAANRFGTIAVKNLPAVAGDYG